MFSPALIICSHASYVEDNGSMPLSSNMGATGSLSGVYRADFLDCGEDLSYREIYISPYYS